MFFTERECHEVDSLRVQVNGGLVWAEWIHVMLSGQVIKLTELRLEEFSEVRVDPHTSTSSQLAQYSKKVLRADKHT